MSAANKVFEAATKEAMKIFKKGKISPKTLVEAAEKVMQAATRALKKAR